MREEERDRERERVEEEERTNGKRRGKRKGEEERIHRRTNGKRKGKRKGEEERIHRRRREEWEKIKCEEKRGQLLQVAESTLGPMTRVSQYCKALRPPSEPLNCCHNGKVSLRSTW